MGQLYEYRGIMPTLAAAAVLLAMHPSGVKDLIFVVCDGVTLTEADLKLVRARPLRAHPSGSYKRRHGPVAMAFG